MNRFGKISNWLSDFAEVSLRKVEASYLDKLKEMMEQGSNKKFATIDEALNDFASRLSLTQEKRASLKDVLQVVAFRKEDIDKQISNGIPVEAIANEYGNSDEEKKIITDYVESQERVEKDRRSEIVRDVGRDIDTKAPGSIGISPKSSSLKNAGDHTFVEKWPHKLPEGPSGSAGSEWAEKMYDRASRYVKIEFKGSKPMVTVFNTKTMKLTTPEVVESLYRDLKVALLSDVGSVLLEQYMKRFEKEPLAGLQDEASEVTTQRMLSEAEDLIEKVIRKDPELRGGVRDEEQASALLREVLDFSEGKLASLLEQARMIVLQIKSTEDVEVKKTLQSQLEEVLEEIKTIKTPVAEKMKGIIVFPTGQKISHSNYYMMLDKKRRVDFLKILMTQAKLDPKVPSYTGHMGRKIMPNLVFYPKDNWKYLNTEAGEGLYIGMPTMKATSPSGQPNKPNPNFGQDIDFSKYGFSVASLAKAEEKLKGLVLQIVKDAIMKDEPLTTIKDGVFRISDIEDDTFFENMMDLTDPNNPKAISISDKKNWKPTVDRIFKAHIRPLSVRMAAIGDVVFIDGNGNVYDTEESLFEANEDEIKQANQESMLSDIDDMLMIDLKSEGVSEEEFALAAELYGRIQKVAKEVGGKEGLQLQRIAAILDENLESEKGGGFKYRKALPRFSVIFKTEFIKDESAITLALYKYHPVLISDIERRLITKREELCEYAHKMLRVRENDPRPFPENVIDVNQFTEKNGQVVWTKAGETELKEGLEDQVVTGSPLREMDNIETHKWVQQYVQENQQEIMKHLRMLAKKGKVSSRAPSLVAKPFKLSLPQFKDMTGKELRPFLTKMLHDGIFDPILRGKPDEAEYQSRLEALREGKEVYYPPEKGDIEDMDDLPEELMPFKKSHRSLSLVRFASDEAWWYINTYDMAIVGPFGSMEAVTNSIDQKEEKEFKLSDNQVLEGFLEVLEPTEKEYAMASLSVKALRQLAECADRLDTKGEVGFAQQIDNIIVQACKEYGVTPLYDAVKEFHPTGSSTTQLDNKVKNDGAKVETITEQQEKDLEVATKNPTGVLACRKCGLTHIAAIVKNCPSCNESIV